MVAKSLRIRVRSVLLWAIVLAVAGCTFKPAEGQLKCQADSDCLDDWICSPTGWCHSSEEEFSTDTQSDGDPDGGDTDTD